MIGSLHYGGTDGVIVAHDGVVLLLPSSFATTDAVELHALLRRGGGLMELLEALGSRGLGAIPDLVAFDARSEPPRVLLRGAASAEAEGSRLTSGGATTWQEHPVTGDDLDVQLTGEAGTGARLPLTSGVVHGDTLAWRADVGEGRHAKPASGDGNRGEAWPAAEHEDMQADDMPAAQHATPSTSVVGAAAVAPSAPLEAPVPEAQPEPLSPAGAPIPAPSAAPAAVAPSDDDEEGDPYDRLFGATTFLHQRPASADVPSEDPPAAPPVAQPAASVDQTLIDVPDGDSDPKPLDADSGLPTETADAAPSSAATKAAASPRQGLISSVPISSVPGFGDPDHSGASKVHEVVPPPPPQAPVAAPATPVAAPPPAPPSAANPNPPVEGAELTVSRAGLAAMRQPTGPLVHAVLCPAGHPNPPEGVRCRVCGVEVPAQAAVTVPRPPLGEFVLEGNYPGAPATIVLRGPLLLGRRPSLSAPADPMPILVEIPSPERDISRTHLSIALEGWHVLVTDLDSVNGTVVTPPGEQPQRLRASEPTLIVPGTLLTLADVVHYRFEAGT